MYIPKVNLSTNLEEIVSFMKRFSFATLITANEGIPEATHLPFIIELRGETIVLKSHFAKENTHWQDIERNKVLVIFSEPHAYISTKNYDKELNVPTWNYVAVHVYGQGKIFTEPNDTFKVLEETIIHFETSYKEQWDDFPEDYKMNMSKGIVAFEIEVSEVQAKKKLSQNRSETEKGRIIETLSKSTDTNENLIGSFMASDSLSK